MVCAADLDLAIRRVFPPRIVVEVKALACELPAEQNVPLSRFSTTDIAREAVHRGIVASISGATVWRVEVSAHQRFKVLTEN